MSKLKEKPITIPGAAMAKTAAKKIAASAAAQERNIERVRIVRTVLKTIASYSIFIPVFGSQVQSIFDVATKIAEKVENIYEALDQEQQLGIEVCQIVVIVSEIMRSASIDNARRDGLRSYLTNIEKIAKDIDRYMSERPERPQKGVVANPGQIFKVRDLPDRLRDLRKQLDEAKQEFVFQASLSQGAELVKLTERLAQLESKPTSNEPNAIESVNDSLNGMEQVLDERIEEIYETHTQRASVLKDVRKGKFGLRTFRTRGRATKEIKAGTEKVVDQEKKVEKEEQEQKVQIEVPTDDGNTDNTDDAEEERELSIEKGEETTSAPSSRPNPEDSKGSEMSGRESAPAVSNPTLLPKAVAEPISNSKEAEKEEIDSCEESIPPVSSVSSSLPKSAPATTLAPRPVTEIIGIIAATKPSPTAALPSPPAHPSSVRASNAKPAPAVAPKPRALPSLGFPSALRPLRPLHRRSRSLSPLPPPRMDHDPPPPEDDVVDDTEKSNTTTPAPVPTTEAKPAPALPPRKRDISLAPPINVVNGAERPASANVSSIRGPAPNREGENGRERKRRTMNVDSLRALADECRGRFRRPTPTPLQNAAYDSVARAKSEGFNQGEPELEDEADLEPERDGTAEREQEQDTERQASGSNTVDGEDEEGDGKESRKGENAAIHAPIVHSRLSEPEDSPGQNEDTVPPPLPGPSPVRAAVRGSKIAPTLPPRQRDVISTPAPSSSPALPVLENPAASEVSDVQGSAPNRTNNDINRKALASMRTLVKGCGRIGLKRPAPTPLQAMDGRIKESTPTPAIASAPALSSSSMVDGETETDLVKRFEDALKRTKRSDSGSSDGDETLYNGSLDSITIGPIVGHGARSLSGSTVVASEEDYCDNTKSIPSKSSSDLRVFVSSPDGEVNKPITAEPTVVLTQREKQQNLNKWWSQKTSGSTSIAHQAQRTDVQ